MNKCERVRADRLLLVVALCFRAAGTLESVCLLHAVNGACALNSSVLLADLAAVSEKKFTQQNIVDGREGWETLAARGKGKTLPAATPPMQKS